MRYGNRWCFILSEGFWQNHHDNNSMPDSQRYYSLVILKNNCCWSNSSNCCFSRISRNSLTSLPIAAFSMNTNLQYLYAIVFSSSSDLFQTIYYQLTSPRDFSGNQITSIRANTFIGLSSLTTL